MRSLHREERTVFRPLPPPNKRQGCSAFHVGGPGRTTRLSSPDHFPHTTLRYSAAFNHRTINLYPSRHSNRRPIVELFTPYQHPVHYSPSRCPTDHSNYTHSPRLGPVFIFYPASHQASLPYGLRTICPYTSWFQMSPKWSGADLTDNTILLS